MLEGDRQGKGEHGKNHTGHPVFFTGSLSDRLGVEMETGVGVRVAGLDSTNKLSVTITGW